MIKKIAVMGAGTMGHAIGGCFAMYGYEVHIYETFSQARLSCKDKIKSQYEFLSRENMMEEERILEALANIHMFDSLKEAVLDADYVIEAIPEKLELKQELMKELDKYCKPSAILATNTSSLSLSKIMDPLPEERRAKILVCHWYNPGHLMPLIELSYFGNMSEEDYKQVEDLYLSIHKRPAKVLKDIPGLLANRIQQGIAREVFSLIEMEAAKPEDIDIALKFGPAFRYATTGHLEVSDFGGLDIWCAVGDNLLSVMDNSTSANPILRKKTEEGKLGFKTGEGFFSYPEDKKEQIQENFNRRLVRQLKTSKEY